MTAAPGAGWWTRAFGRRYLDVYAHRDEGSAASEAAFVVSLLGLAKGAPLLDAGCGAGRHARALASLGAEVVGVDLSSDLLVAARASGGARYVLADFRRLPFASASFAHVVSLFTSFGYDDEAADAAQLAEFARVLRPRGSLVLDFLNAPLVEATLVPRSERDVSGSRVTERRRLRAGRVEKDVEIRSRDGALEDAWTESVRLYRRAELEALAARAGFAVTSAHGGLDGRPWNEAAPRLVLTAVTR